VTDMSLGGWIGVFLSHHKSMWNLPFPIVTKNILLKSLLTAAKT
jgi:hypothetical protein